jgi:hypothetical protein
MDKAPVYWARPKLLNQRKDKSTVRQAGRRPGSHPIPMLGGQKTALVDILTAQGRTSCVPDPDVRGSLHFKPQQAR